MIKITQAPSQVDIQKYRKRRNFVDAILISIIVLTGVIFYYLGTQAYTPQVAPEVLTVSPRPLPICERLNYSCEFEFRNATYVVKCYGEEFHYNATLINGTIYIAATEDEIIQACENAQMMVGVRQVCAANNVSCTLELGMIKFVYLCEGIEREFFTKETDLQRLDAEIKYVKEVCKEWYS